METQSLSNDKGLLAAAEYSRTHDDDPEHAAQVCRLAMQIFDQSVAVHGLGEEDKRLLAAGALLHDLGWKTRPAAHHKGSRDIILVAEIDGFTPKETAMIACLARYHRKAHPKDHHKVFRGLNTKARDRVRKLAALLRIADGFDRSHASTVKKLRVRVQEKTFTIAVEQEPHSALDIMGAERKKGLFEEVFGREVVIQPPSSGQRE